MDRRDAKPRPLHAPFFVIGTGRCGSTLLQAMLISHSRIRIPPETHFFARFDPALAFADPLPEDADAAYVAHCRADPLWTELGLDADGLTAALAAGCRDAAGLFAWWMQSLVGPEALEAGRVGEKTPRHEQNVPRIARLFPDARFVHIHRDPRDVVASIRGMDWRSSDSLAQLALECRRTYRRQQRFARELGPDRHLTLAFEALVADPERELTRVCEFLGERFEPGMLDFQQRDESGYLASEGAWKDRTRQPLDRTRIGRYREQLPARDIRRIERLLEKQLDQLGYSRTRAPAWRPDWWWADWRDARKRRRRAASASGSGSGGAPA